MNYLHLQVIVRYTIKNVLTCTYLKHETANSQKQQLTASTLSDPSLKLLSVQSFSFLISKLKIENRVWERNWKGDYLPLILFTYPQQATEQYHKQVVQQDCQVQVGKYRTFHLLSGLSSV